MQKPAFGARHVSRECDHVHVSSQHARTGPLLQEGALWFFRYRV